MLNDQQLSSSPSHNIRDQFKVETTFDLVAKKVSEAALEKQKYAWLRLLGQIPPMRLRLT